MSTGLPIQSARSLSTGRDLRPVVAGGAVGSEVAVAGGAVVAFVVVVGVVAVAAAGGAADTLDAGALGADDDEVAIEAAPATGRAAGVGGATTAGRVIVLSVWSGEGASTAPVDCEGDSTIADAEAAEPTTLLGLEVASCFCRERIPMNASPSDNPSASPTTVNTSG